MDIDISEFLPKYPNIVKVDDNDLFNPYGDEDFYESIYKKKEFYDERVPKTEPFPELPGLLMKHQKILARFLSARTPYDKILLMLQMGVGKTCAAIGAVEEIKNQPDSGFTGALVFARGEGLLNNFINELVFKCTAGQYIPEDFENLTDLEKVHRINKSTKGWYTMHTFETFAKDVINKLSDEALIEKFSNKIIIIDEVHNLRLQEKVQGLEMYKQFHRFLHVVENCKIILMSGTPMKDSPEEIASVMNLLLPVDEQLPTGEQFTKDFLTSSGSIKPSKIKTFKKALKGRVSYLKAMQSSVKKVMVGTQIGDLRHFAVAEDTMSSHQTEGYIKAMERDEGEAGIYSFARQASLFVFPDGTYGPEGFDKYVQTITSKKMRRGGVKDVSTYRLTPELRAKLTGATPQESLAKLAVYSSKYAATIENIVASQEEGKSVFVYCEFVKGGGAILFSLCLELYGFVSTSGGKLEVERPRYALVTNKTATQTTIKKTVAAFNRPENMNGNFIRVIIGSKVIGEGFSLKNVQEENILTPHWNYAETDQAIARGYRLGSHQDLIRDGITPVVKVYQRASIPSRGKFQSIDLKMYEISEDKDIAIKKIERAIKEAAFDCALTYDRNYTPGNEGTRECEYDNCEYVCDGVSPGLMSDTLTNEQLDLSTYQLYYSSPREAQIIRQIIAKFNDTFSLDIETFFTEFTEFTRFEIISALRTVVNENYPVTNKYGLRSYMREEDNVFFLVDSLSVISTFQSEYYTRNPTLKFGFTFNRLLTSIEKEYLPALMDKICKAELLITLSESINKLPLELQEVVLEETINARVRGIKSSTRFQGLVLEYYKDYYSNIEGTWTSWLPSRQSDGFYRCRSSTGVWDDCSDEMMEAVKTYREKTQTDILENPYGYYAMYNRELNSFCIRDVSRRDLIDNPDARKRSKGRKCPDAWKRDELVNIAANILKIAPPVDFLSTNTVAELKAQAKTTRYAKDILKDGMTSEDLRRILYWSSKQIKPTCRALEYWFTENNLIVEDPKCGTSKK
jgi:superfamily II DNA or RNA helicase